MGKVILLVGSLLLVVLLLWQVAKPRFSSTASENGGNELIHDQSNESSSLRPVAASEISNELPSHHNGDTSMDDTTQSRELAQKYVEQHAQEKIKQIAVNEGETFAQTLSLFPPKPLKPGEVALSSEQIVTNYEKNLKENFIANLSKEMSGAELQELALMHKNPSVDLLAEAKLNYQAQLLEGRHDKDAEKHHKQLVVIKEEPARLELIDKIDELLGESTSTLQHSMMMTKLMQGQEADGDSNIAPKQVEEFKKVMKKLSLAYYSSLSDQDLQNYISLLETHPALVKEQKVLQRSIKDTIRQVAK